MSVSDSSPADTRKNDQITSTAGKSVREIAILISVYGIPTVVAAAGIAMVIVVAFETQSIRGELKVILALFLILFGLLSQLWLYARQNPPATNEILRIMLEHDRETMEMICAIQTGMGKKDEQGQRLGE